MCVCVCVCLQIGTPNGWSLAISLTTGTKCIPSKMAYYLVLFVLLSLSLSLSLSFSQVSAFERNSKLDFLVTAPSDNVR